MEPPEIRIVKSPILAKKLLKEGYSIVDLRPNRYDKKLSVFAFECNESIDNIIEEYKEGMRIKREQRKNILKMLS
ncbi:DUF5659 domain-containing protein [Clostridium sp. 001]|uniref:DUF5659 domain-containing protein n=1 Tax=Clostridium sp. 001 TaxID=1970093 RepID=UPI001C2CACED|nr:DUF5659 domain-containing protein [Clostridium sp. 001]QXE20034.1 hypothetical protein B5S50_15040 [Clostridium sp. 001]